MFKVTQVSIAYDKANSRTRYFVEVCINGQWNDVGNCDSEQEANELKSRVVIVGNSWRA